VEERTLNKNRKIKPISQHLITVVDYTIFFVSSFYAKESKGPPAFTYLLLPNKSINGKTILKPLLGK
jgi:hypothetical protein